MVCQYYKEHCQSKQPIPVTHLREPMGLILKENSFKFHNKHFLQTHGIAKGSKMAVAFAVICITHVEKQLRAASPQKPSLWKRFIHDIFSVWTLPENEISNFIHFTNSFQVTIKFTHQVSSEKKNCFPRYRSFQETTFRWEQEFGCSNTLQAYRNVSIYAPLFKSPSQCREGFYERRRFAFTENKLG